MFRLGWCALLVMALAAAPLNKSSAARRPVPAKSTTACNAVALADHYLKALTNDNYAAMWRMLAQATRQAWHENPREFARYEHTKFERLISALPGAAATKPGGVVEVQVHLRWKALPATQQVNALGESLLADYPLTVATGPCVIRDAGFTATDTPLVVPVQPMVAATQVPILMYHDISSLPTATNLAYGLTVTDANFTAQLAYLAAHGYTTITLVELFEHLYYGLSLPRRPIILSFDDGYDNAYSDAFPILRHFGDVGVFNIITGFVGLRGVGVNSYVTWPQLAAMKQAGMEIESHTAYHEDLGAIAPGVAHNEMLNSRETLQQRLGAPAQFLTYPSGEPFRSESVAAQDLILALDAQVGYVGALLDPITASTIQQAAQPYELSRVRVSGGEGLVAFIASL